MDPVFREILFIIWAVTLDIFDIWRITLMTSFYSLKFFGSAAAFLIIWCTAITIMAIVGVSRVSVALAICAILAINEQHKVAISLVATIATMYLWAYWSWWTILVISMGAWALQMDCPNFVLVIWMLYSAYSVLSSAGLLGLILALNLAFISSKILKLYVLTDPNRTNSPQGQSVGTHDQDGTTSGSTERSTTRIRDPRRIEFARLLNSTDHYSAFGLPLFQNVDATWLSQQFSLKAFLVHPIRHPGYEKAARAFQKLQDAYEVLIDPFKRQEYDSELRRELIWNFLRKLVSLQIGRPGMESLFSRFKDECEDPRGIYRCVWCSNCRSNYHLWVKTSRSASHGRWCQECKKFHPAKNGEGWIEHIPEPILLGLFYKKGQPRAYVCADGRVFQATQWYLCQGMNCAANTHEPGFTYTLVMPGAEGDESTVGWEPGIENQTDVWVWLHQWPNNTTYEVPAAVPSPVEFGWEF